MGPLSEIFGRSRVVQLANLFYLGIYTLHHHDIPLLNYQLQHGTLAVVFLRTRVN